MTPAADDGTVRWRSLLAEAEDRLAGAGIPDPEVSARRIVEEASGFEGAEYILGLDEPATQRGVAWFDTLLERRASGEPLQYVLGHWAFRTLDLMVDRRVLIPRPETEQVVEGALAELDQVRVERTREHLVAVDLGTGSGAIALALAMEREWVDVWATDVSSDALAVAAANLAGIGRPAARVRLAEGSWYDALPDELAGRVDLIISNPPYIAEHEVLPAEVVDWEPTGALIAGEQGTEAIEIIVRGASRWLSERGSVVLEIAPHQRDPVTDLAEGAGLVVRVREDLSGRARVAIATRRG